MPLRARRYIAIAAGQEKQVTNWLGKFWPLRLALWIIAAVLCLAIWPVAISDVLPRERLHAVGQYFEERYSSFGNPILLTGGSAIEAWDWQTGKRWRLPVSWSAEKSIVDVVSDGRTSAVAELDPHRGIVLTDVMPPHEQEVYPLPKEWQDGPLAMTQRQGIWSTEDLEIETEIGQLVMIDPRVKFAVVARYEVDSMAVYVVELATGKIVDTKTKIDEAYTLGNGGLELTQFEQVTSPKPDVIVRSTRWKLSDTGQLVDPVEKPEGMQADGLSPIGIFGIYSVTSADGRYEAVKRSDDPMVIRERESGRVLQNIPVSDLFTTDISFSTDGKYLLAGNSFTDLRVFDLESQSLVVADRRIERRGWRSRILMTASAIPFLLALALALRTASFERMAWDFVLATLFLDSFAAAIALLNNAMPQGFGSFGAAMAIGTYWAFGPQPLWKRLFCGTAGIATLFGSLFAASGWVNEASLTNEQLTMVLTTFVFVATVCALGAWLMTLPLGWRIAREESTAGGSRFQFGISTMCLAITFAAITSAMVGRFTQEAAMVTDTPLWILAVASVTVLSLILVGVLAMWLLLWLWFRQHTRASLLLALSGVVTMFVLVSAALIAVRFAFETGGFALATASPVAYEIMYMLAPLVLQCAWFSFALWLARRHGYRWIKASKPILVIDDAVGAAA